MTIEREKIMRNEICVFGLRGGDFLVVPVNKKLLAGTGSSQ